MVHENFETRLAKSWAKKVNRLSKRVKELLEELDSYDEEYSLYEDDDGYFDLEKELEQAISILQFFGLDRDDLIKSGIPTSKADEIKARIGDI